MPVNEIFVRGGYFYYFLVLQINAVLLKYFVFRNLRIGKFTSIDVRG